MDDRKNEDIDVVLSIKVPKSLKEWLKVVAKKDKRSLSNYVAWLLDKHKENFEAKE